MSFRSLDTTPILWRLDFAVDRFPIVELAATVLEFAGAGSARRLFLPREGDNPIFLPILAGIG